MVGAAQVRTFASASSSATHTARFDPATGRWSCSCPAWRFPKGGSPRTCKHTREIEAEGVEGAKAQAREDRASAIALRGYDAMPADVARVTAPSSREILPMLAVAMTKGRTVDDFAGSPEWTLEEKYDGHRVVVRKAGDRVQAWSRPKAGNLALARELPADVERAVRTLPDGLYDGELIVRGGRSWDVSRLTTTKALVLFDVCELLGQSTIRKTYRERRELLALALQHYDAPADASPLFMPTTEPVCVEAVQAIWARGGEGAILKRLSSTYQPGRRSDDWVKVKRAGSAVLTITGYEAGKCGEYSKVTLRADDGRETSAKTKDNATRAAIAANPQSFIGRRLVIAYTELTDTGSFRHGVWDHLAGAGE
jgi:ATP-dependent DNA ligase